MVTDHISYNGEVTGHITYTVVTGHIVQLSQVIIYNGHRSLHTGATGHIVQEAQVTLYNSHRLHDDDYIVAVVTGCRSHYTIVTF